MDLQIVIVALIILAALAYAGNAVRLKVGAFRPKTGACGADCGCGGKTPAKL